MASCTGRKIFATRPRRSAMPSPVTIVPSALSANYSRLGEDMAALEKAGADRVQWDVMDGRFVPNLTVGADVVAACRESTSLPFEAHLMIVEPDLLAPKFVKAGCEVVIVHEEACTHLHRTLASIRDQGAKAGVALNPSTPIESVRHVIDLVDLLLVMTVNPGFGGQKYISTMEPKIAEAAKLIASAEHHVDLEVDGGISASTVAGAVGAGARVLVAGSALFGHPEGLESAVAELRANAERAVG